MTWLIRVIVCAPQKRLIRCETKHFSKSAVSVVDRMPARNIPVDRSLAPYLAADGNNYRNPDKPDAGVKDIQEKALDDIQMVSVPEADEFPVLIGVCLNDPFVEGVKAQNCQNHPADDLKPHIVPGIDAQELRYAEKTKEQDKDVA